MVAISVENAAAQVAISNPAAAPHVSAMLEIKSDNRGFLMPRIANRASVAAPATGLMIYEIATNSVLVYNGADWMTFGSSGGGGQWLTNGTHIYNGNTGNVGVGINLPASKFHLVGNLKQDNGIVVLNNAAGEINFQNAGVEKAFLQLSGNNLRVGTVSPNDAGRFIVRTNASDRLIVDSTGNVQIIGEQDAELNTHGYLMLGRTTGTNLIFDNNEIMARNNGGTSDLILQNDGGSVGIGTTPDEKLDVAGHTKLKGSSPLIKMEAAVGGTGSPVSSLRYAPGLQFLRQGTTTVLGKMEYVDTANYSNFLRFYTGATPSNDLTVTTGHNVGIGTSDPQAKLHLLWGTGEQLRISGADPIIQFTDHFGAQDKKGYLRVNGNDLVVGTNTANNTGNFIVTTNGIESIKANASGNVGIGLGAASPQGKLHVAGKIIAEADGEALKIDGNVPVINFYHNAAFKSFITQSASKLYIGANGTLQLDGSSGVAIGEVRTGGSNYKLAVAGNVVCEELRVKLRTAWPDYVFKNSYRLMPLPELQNFITRRGHLPNVPSAVEVEKEGIAVGDMQKRLLEKVEELTLYILDLQKQIDELKKAKQN